MFGAGAVIIGGAVVLAMIRLAGWREPESEEEFEAIVRRAERLAAQDAWDETPEDEPEDDELIDPHNEEDFKAIVRSAIDDLPLEFHRALEHVAIVVSDGGRAAAGLRPLPGRHGRPGLLPRPDRDLPRHAACATSATTPSCSRPRSPAPCATSSPTISAGTRRASAGLGL